jgi:hypothetical protein
MAELFQHLSGGVQINGGTDAGGDRTVREHLRHRGQPLGRDQGIGAGMGSAAAWSSATPSGIQASGSIAAPALPSPNGSPLRRDDRPPLPEQLPQQGVLGRARPLPAQNDEWNEFCPLHETASPGHLKESHPADMGENRTSEAGLRIEEITAADPPGHHPAKATRRPHQPKHQTPK